MRTTTMAVALFVAAASTHATAQAPSGPASRPAIPERGDDSKRASKNARLEGEIDGVGIVVTYGRPQVRGRKVWGKLVPYGKVWRTGADEATTITFDRPVEVEGEELARGTYALFTKPGADEWEVIFNADPEQWGAYKHDSAKDVLRVDARPTRHDHTEALKFEIRDGKLVLLWEKLALPIRIEKAG
jgi:hypothetical protein